MRWRFWRTPAARIHDETMVCLRWETDMARAGWLHWAEYPPDWFLHEVVETKRREWPMIGVQRVASVHPATNVNGLWWKPARSDLPGPGGILELRKTPLGYV